MRILYHHRVASKDGQYVHIEEIISSLRNLGHEVIVCEPKSIQSTEFGEGSNTVQRMRALLPGFVHELAEMLYSVPDYLKIRKLIKKNKPDCIYERYNLFFTSGIWASKRFGLPILVEVNAPLFMERSQNEGVSLRRLAQWSEDYVWNNANTVVPVTNVLGKMVQARGVDRDRVTVIPNGINDSFSVGLPEIGTVDEKYGLEGKLVMGFVGFVREWHRLDRVLKFIGDSPDQSRHLLLVGDGPDLPRLKALAKNLGISDSLTITGIIERDQIPGLVQRFDVALQPDVVPYASPLKMFEYMALGKPILAPNTENIREILIDGKNALLFEQADESFGEKLNQLCSDSELRQTLGSAARSSIDNKELYWDCNARKVVGIFESLGISN